MKQNKLMIPGSGGGGRVKATQWGTLGNATVSSPFVKSSFDSRELSTYPCKRVSRVICIHPPSPSKLLSILTYIYKLLFIILTDPSPRWK